jgi:hypothetical protein
MQREKSKWRTHKDESTEAGHRGGPERRSEEAPVMGAEQRTPGHPAFEIDQPAMGGVIGESKAVCDTQTSSLGSV